MSLYSSKAWQRTGSCPSLDCGWLIKTLIISLLRLIGFEDLGNNDSFSDGALELRLAQTGTLALPCADRQDRVADQGTTGALQKPNSSGLEPIYQVASSKKHNYADDDEEFDL